MPVTLDGEILFEAAEVSTTLPPADGRPTVGDTVLLLRSNEGLSAGDVCVVASDDHDSRPYKLTPPTGGDARGYFRAHEVQKLLAVPNAGVVSGGGSGSHTGQGALLTAGNARVGLRVTVGGGGSHTGQGTLLGWKVGGTRHGDTGGGLSSDNFCRVNFENGGEWNLSMLEVTIVGAVAASFVVAGGGRTARDGRYVQVGGETNEGRAVYSQQNGPGKIYFQSSRWRVTGNNGIGGWWYSSPESTDQEPPTGQWTTQGYTGEGAEPAPTVSRGDAPGREHSFGRDQCRVCLGCGACTGFGARCCNHADGRPRGEDCGCGGGDRGCDACGLCRSCSEAWPCGTGGQSPHVVLAAGGGDGRTEVTVGMVVRHRQNGTTHTVTAVQDRALEVNGNITIDPPTGSGAMDNIELGHNFWDTFERLPVGRVVVLSCPQGHELRDCGTAADNGWACDARNEPGGCLRGCTGFRQSAGWGRWQCQPCDYDICDRCAAQRRSGPAPAATARRLVEGDRVSLAPGQSASRLPRRWRDLVRDVAVIGIGMIIEDDHSDVPYKVRSDDGQTHWFAPADIVAAVDGGGGASGGGGGAGSDWSDVGGRPTVGDHVRLKISKEGLSLGDICEVMSDDEDDDPFKLKKLGTSSTKQYFKEEHVQKITAAGQASSATPVRLSPIPPQTGPLFCSVHS